jgi:hypothetical protein
MTDDLPPDHRAFLDDVAAAPFQIGVDQGKWRLDMIEWPHAAIHVTARSVGGAVSSYAFRFELGGYPGTPPNAQPWHAERNAPLEAQKWPAGGERITKAFNPNWNAHAIYVPCDRLALAAHGDWTTRYPAHRWRPDVGITCYLRLLHDLLNSPAYTGPRG